MPEAVIVGGVRTPFVRAGGPLMWTSAQELGRLVVRELFYRFDLDPSEVDELIAGNVVGPPEAVNVARVIALRAGIPRDRIAHTVSRNCASGFECLTEAIERVSSGRSRCVVAVGVDSMSHIPVYWSKRLTDKFGRLARARGRIQKLKALSRFRPGDLRPKLGIKLGLTDPVTGLMMGETAEKLAREFHISREEQDAFALRSHQRAVAAWNDGRLYDEVMTVYPETVTRPVSSDVGPRADQSPGALGKLKPYFDRRWGSVTVGNSCQVTDGAAALLVMQAERAKSLGLNPLGRVRAYAYTGCDPARMGLGPVYATGRALKAAGMQLSEMGLIEVNEAFAAQVLACLRAFAFRGSGFDALASDCFNRDESDLLGPVDEERLNVNGGAIALGHPVGATGARLVLTLLHELARRDQNVGLATLCVGGGQGGAVIVERIGTAT